MLFISTLLKIKYVLLNNVTIYSKLNDAVKITTVVNKFFIV